MSATQTAETGKHSPAPSASNGTKRTRGPNKDAGTKLQPRQQEAPAKAAAAKAEPQKPAAKALPAKVGSSAAARPQVIQSLVQMLPEAGTKWSQEDAVSWMEAIASSLRLVYQFGGAITVTGTPAAAR